MTASISPILFDPLLSDKWTDLDELRRSLFAQRSVIFDFNFGKFLRTGALSLIHERLQPVSSMASISKPLMHKFTKSRREEGDLPFGQSTNTGLSRDLTGEVSLLAARSHSDGRCLATSSLNHSQNGILELRAVMKGPKELFVYSLLGPDDVNEFKENVIMMR
jgi:hypothetical protein